MVASTQQFFFFVKLILLTGKHDIEYTVGDPKKFHSRFFRNVNC
jgi:hypothetical protein